MLCSHIKKNTPSKIKWFETLRLQPDADGFQNAKAVLVRDIEKVEIIWMIYGNQQWKFQDHLIKLEKVLALHFTVGMIVNMAAKSQIFAEYIEYLVNIYFITRQVIPPRHVITMNGWH
jgi:hypothetical protein